MAETITLAAAIEKLREVPFTVSSIVETCTAPGSYSRSLSRCAHRCIRDDIDKVIALLERCKVKDD